MIWAILLYVAGFFATAYIAGCEQAANDEDNKYLQPNREYLGFVVAISLFWPLGLPLMLGDYLFNLAYSAGERRAQLRK